MDQLFVNDWEMNKEGNFMRDVIEAIEDFLKKEFGDYQFMGAGCQQKPTPGYRYHFRDEDGRAHNIHFSNPFLQDHTPEEVVPILEGLGVEISAREFAVKNVVVLINNRGINIKNLPTDKNESIPKLA